MAGSAADTPTTPEFIRISDVDRDRAVDELRKEFVDGRLSHETFLLRMHAALDARNRGQLSGLFSDLPPRLSWLARARRTVREWRCGPRAVAWGGRGHEASRQSYAEQRYDEQRYDEQRYDEQRYDEQRYDEEPSKVPAMPEPARAPKPLAFPPGSDTSFTIGRDQRCDLYIADMTVSRLHARLARDGDGWLLSDLGSSNGTRVNGWRLRAAVPVQPGDTITFGSAVFTLQSERQYAAQSEGQQAQSEGQHAAQSEG